MTDGTVRTYSGLLIHLLEPGRNVVLVEDIAHSLANQCRFTGHMRVHYSVAEHCCRGVDWLAQVGRELDGPTIHPTLREFIGCGLEEAQRAFLLHDAAETYLGDVAGPLKRLPMFQGYRELERAWNETLAYRFGLPVEFTELAGVKLLDDMLLQTEQRDVRRYADYDATRTLRERIEPWSAAAAEVAWLDHYRRLYPRGENSIEADERRVGA